MQFQKPKKLTFGDTIGIVTPSWGGPGTFPHIYENGIKALQSIGFKTKEYPLTRKDADFIAQNPKLRAEDINAAFADPEVQGIIASIGGDDSVRILPFLDINLISQNPKFFMGYSDSTTIHTFLNSHGLVTFYGPSIMAGFSQWEALGEKFQNHIKDFLLGDSESYNYSPYDFYSDGYPNWSSVENTGKINEKKSSDGWHFLQGTGIVSGPLFGGCIDVLEFLKGTEYWPSPDFWNEKILFLETSEDKPDLNTIKIILRNYGMQGIFNKIKALIFGRLRDYSTEEKKEFDQELLNLLQTEFSLKDLPVVTNMDFGHTDPQFILPLGVKAELDFTKKSFKLLENPYIN